jgi:tRNA A-37 threonylcarbamoyl transferase component Bud32
MEDSAVARLLPSGTRTIRLFTAPEVASGAVSVPGWEDAGMQLVKLRSRGRAVVGNGVFLKEYIYCSRWEKFRRRFMPPRPFIALAAARKLETLAVPTPRVLIAARGIAPDGAVCDLLATERLATDVTFGDRIPAGEEGLAEMLTPVLLHLHDNGFLHGDLSLRNWYVTPDGRWGLIDLDGAVRTRRVSKFRRTAELARLASSCFLVYRRDSDLAGLNATAEEYLRSYIHAGGSVYEDRFRRQMLSLVNRFRAKYLHLDAIK